jgi:hypothetical protein
LEQPAGEVFESSHVVVKEIAQQFDLDSLNAEDTFQLMLEMKV